jgi:hypothetical protein
MAPMFADERVGHSNVMKAILYHVLEPCLCAVIVFLVLLTPRTMSGLAGMPPPDALLFISAGSREYDLLETALAEGAAVNSHDPNGMTALMCASSAGDVRAANRLLGLGAIISDKDNQGMSALQHAVVFDHADIVDLLFARQRNPGDFPDLQAAAQLADRCGAGRSSKLIRGRIERETIR